MNPKHTRRKVPQRVFIHQPTGAEIWRSAYGRLPYKLEIRWTDGSRTAAGTVTVAELHHLLHPKNLEKLNMAIKKRAELTGQTGTAAEIQPCGWAMEHPALYEFVALTTYEDGSPRTPGSFTIFQKTEGGIGICISDKDTGEVAFAVADCFTTLFEVVERKLTVGTLDWRKPNATKKRK